MKKKEEKLSSNKSKNSRNILLRYTHKALIYNGQRTQRAFPVFQRKNITGKYRQKKNL